MYDMFQNLKFFPRQTCEKFMIIVDEEGISSVLLESSKWYFPCDYWE
jgi:hypothetical protein